MSDIKEKDTSKEDQTNKNSNNCSQKYNIVKLEQIDDITKKQIPEEDYETISCQIEKTLSSEMTQEITKYEISNPGFIKRIVSYVKNNDILKRLTKAEKEANKEDSSKEPKEKSKLSFFKIISSGILVSLIALGLHFWSNIIAAKDGKNLEMLIRHNTKMNQHYTKKIAEDFEKIKNDQEKYMDKQAKATAEINEQLKTSYTILKKSHRLLVYRFKKLKRDTKHLSRFNRIYGSLGIIFDIDEVSLERDDSDYRTINLSFTWKIHKNYIRKYKKAKKGRYSISISGNCKSKLIDNYTIDKKCLDAKRQNVRIQIPKFFGNKLRGRFKVNITLMIGNVKDFVSVNTWKFKKRR